MNLLEPELIWVDNRCYRYHGKSNWLKTRNISPYVEDNGQVDYEDDDDEICNDNIEIVPHGATKFKHTFHVAKAFFPHIIGAKHATCKKIETETKTVIQIPNVGQDGNIEIIGSDHKGIMKARLRINLLVEAKRHRIQPTHFLSIPMNEGHIILKFNIFKNDVLTNSEKMSKCVDETIFQIPSKLHLTFGVLKLLDDAESDRAIEALNYCKKHILKPIIEKYGQIHIYLQGTEIMNDDSTEVSVLYAKVTSTNNVLQEIADKIVTHYADIGLISKKTEEVKLHVTLINTKFKLNSKEQTTKKNLMTFDATEILKVHGNTSFGETTLKQIHLSQRHTISSNGYYQAIAKINLFEDQ